MDRVIHFEIPVSDTGKALDFYKKVFGWEFSGYGDQEYWFAKTGEDNNPGINGAVMKRRDPAQPVTNNIQVENIDNSIKSIEENGGVIVVPKIAIPGMGYSSYFKDTDGNILGIWQINSNAK